MAPMINKEMSKIDWKNKTAKQIKDLTRGLNPIMGTYCYINDNKYKFWKLDIIKISKFTEKFSFNIEEIINKEPGTILISDDKNRNVYKSKR